MVCATDAVSLGNQHINDIMLHVISINIVGGYSVVTYATSHPSYHGWKLFC